MAMGAGEAKRIDRQIVNRTINFKKALVHGARWFLPIMLILIAECTIFNTAFWSSRNSHPAESTLSVVSGLQHENGTWAITDPANAILDVSLSKAETIKSLQIQPRDVDEESLQKSGLAALSAGKNYQVSISVKDEANTTEFLPLGTVNIAEGIRRTHFISIHPSGEVKELRIQFLGLKSGTAFKLESVILNPRIPFDFSVLRVSLLAAVIYMIMLFAPSRSMYRWTLNLKEKRQKYILIGYGIFLALAFIVISRLMIPGRTFGITTGLGGAFIYDDNQANHMANAIINGHPYLDLSAPTWMQDLANPYDAWSRARMSQQTGEPTYWDYAYFGGKYYSYFGIIPVLLTFVPFKLITGQDLRTDYAVIVFALALLCAALYFMYVFLKKYFAESSFGQYLLYSLFFVTSSSAIIQVFYPKIYSLPILSSLVLTLSGLGLWLSASDGEKVKKWKLILGSTFLALNLGCRPLFILAIFFAFPIFWGEIKQRLFFSKRGIGNTLSVVVPVLIVGGAAMAWNYIRFGSVTNFGATYNLTGFDMVHRAYAWQRIPSGVWMYLFQPLHIEPNFPFIMEVSKPEGFLGQVIIEPYYGGLFAFAPAALYIGFMLHMWKSRAFKPVRIISVWFGVSALVLVLLDVEIVGVNARYHGDFAWLICLIAIAVHASSYTEYKNERLGSVSLYAFYILVMAGLAVSLWNLLSVGRYGELISHNATLYRLVESFFLALN